MFKKRVYYQSHHDNIVEYIDSYILNEQQLWVVMEFMDGGCLTDILELFDDIKLTEAAISFCIKGVFVCSNLFNLLDP